MIPATIRMTLASLILFLVAVSANAAESRQSYLHVKDMHCKACAQKIANKLYTVSGVVQVDVDLEKNIARVTPQQTKDPSPRGLWEAVEKAGFVPVKLIGPAGQFVEKPSN